MKNLNQNAIHGKLKTQSFHWLKGMDREKILKQHPNKVWFDGYWKTYLPDESNKHGRKLIKKKNKCDLDAVIIEYYLGNEDKFKVRGVFNEWIKRRYDLGEIEKQSLDRYTNAFKKYFDPIADRFISEITEDDLEEFIKKSIKKYNLTVKAYGSLRTVLVGTFRYAKKHSLTEIHISNFIGDLSLPNKMFRKVQRNDKSNVFTAQETALIEERIEQCEERLTDLAVLLGLETGLRAGEVVSLKFSDISGNKMTVCRTEVRYKVNGHCVYEIRDYTKGHDGSREIYVTQKVLDIVERIKRLSTSRVWMFQKNGKVMREYCLTKRLYVLCDNVGIRRRSFHKLRKTYATRLINAKVDERIVLNQMGHTSISTTFNHYYYNDKSDDEVATMISSALL